MSSFSFVLGKLTFTQVFSHENQDDLEQVLF